jgi:hypothetical protein
MKFQHPNALVNLAKSASKFFSRSADDDVVFQRCPPTWALDNCPDNEGTPEYPQNVITPNSDMCAYFVRDGCPTFYCPSDEGNPTQAYADEMEEAYCQEFSCSTSCSDTGGSDTGTPGSDTGTLDTTNLPQSCQEIHDVATSDVYQTLRDALKVCGTGQADPTDNSVGSCYHDPAKVVLTNGAPEVLSDAFTCLAAQDPAGAVADAVAQYQAALTALATTDTAVTGADTAVTGAAADEDVGTLLIGTVLTAAMFL